MKKASILFLLLVTLGSVFTSCATDDSGPVDMKYLSGKWEFDKSTATSKGITINYPTEYFSNEAGCNKDYIIFNTDGTVKYGNYSLNCAFEERTGTWTQADNKITIMVIGSSFNGTFDVASLSATELLLKIDGTLNGQSGTFNLNFTK